ncbi:hypothetical protein V6N11_076111 [Hibiscus sabdariffa]|uniref:DUF632 domain-containing protein n=1 Tax=Hibiscus sabdariffa TaxID=183260 RepID=A0ABR2Q5L5_9ROSI
MKYPFSTHRYLGFGPPIFILGREWSAAVKALPAEDVRFAIKAFLSDLCHQMGQPVEQPPKKEKPVDANKGGGNADIRQKTSNEVRQLCVENSANGPGETSIGKCAPEQSSSKSKKAAEDDDLSAEKDDPSEFITHRTKDFLSSIKDIEHRFFWASEAGREVSKMLESTKTRVGYSETKGWNNESISPEKELNTILRFCIYVGLNVTLLLRNKVQLFASWRSSSSRNPLTTRSKDDADDSGSDFIEEFCMTAGSHSSTLDRLYAWERKLYDEVKTSGSIMKKYDLKCDQLRLQFARDLSTQRIEKMREEELQPQLVELIQGLLRMWKVMLECHHSQYITISLAYHSRNSTGALHGDSRRQIMALLRQEIECFGVSFTDWVNSHASYLEALNGWLQNFSCSKSLASRGSYSCHQMDQPVEQLPKKEKSVNANKGESMSKYGINMLTSGNTNDDASSNLCCIQTSLTHLLDRLNRFFGASLKRYEDVRMKTEAARVTYLTLQTN